MARPNVFGLIFKIDASDQKKFKQIGKEVNALSKDINKNLGGSILNLKNLLIGGALASGFKFIVNSASEMQNSTSAFTTMLGGSEKAAKDLVGTLKQMGASTPFEFKDLANATQTMMQFGIGAEESTKLMSMLGDVAMGDANKLQGLALVMGQVSSAGKLQGQDLMQLINQGFNPLLVMSQKSGKSMAQLRDEMSKGKISADMVKQAFKDATSQGGQFFGGMEKGSKTFSGRMSTMQDAIGQAAEAIGTGLLPSLEKLVLIVTSTAESVSKFLNENKELLPILIDVGLAVGAGYLAFVAANIVIGIAEFLTLAYAGACAAASAKLTIMQFAQWKLNAAIAANPIGLAIIAFAALVAIGVLVYKNWDYLVQKGKDLWSWMKKLWESSQTLRTVLYALGTVAAIALSPIIITVGAIVGAIYGLYKAWQSIKGYLPNWLGGDKTPDAPPNAPSIPGMAGGNMSGPQSSNAGVIQSNQTITNRSTLDVNFNNVPTGTTTKQTGSAPGINLNTGVGMSRG